MASLPILASESTTDSTASFRAMMTDTTTHLLCGQIPQSCDPTTVLPGRILSVLDGHAAGQFTGLRHPMPSATTNSSAISAGRGQDTAGPILSRAHANWCGAKLQSGPVVPCTRPTCDNSTELNGNGERRPQ